MNEEIPITYGNHSRRTSVVPDVSYRRRNTMATLTVKQHQNLQTSLTHGLLGNGGSRPGSSEIRFKKLSGLFNIGTAVQTKVLNFNQTKDEYVSLQEAVCSQQQDWKRLRGFLEHLVDEYEASKGLDPIRRHRRICSAIKRTVLYLRLMNMTNDMATINGSDRASEDSSGNYRRRSRNDSLANVAINGSVLPCEIKSKEARKKFEEQASSFSNEDIQMEMKKTREQIRLYQRKIDAIIAVINEMESRYNQCKDHCIFLRYYFNKKIIKEIVRNHKELFEKTL